MKFLFFKIEKIFLYLLFLVPPVRIGPKVFRVINPTLICPDDFALSGKDMDINFWKSKYEEVPELLTEEERRDWITKLKRVALSSDAFFPFSDNINRAVLVINLFL